MTLLGLQDIKKILQLVLWSGHLQNHNPLSLLITAPVGAGKTELVKEVQFNDGIAYVTDATAFGLARDVLPYIQQGTVKHIIMPDLITPLSKQKSTRESFICFLNGLIEEGIADIRTYGLSKTFENLRCGIVTCVAEEDFKSMHRSWKRVGFLSRCLPVSWGYSKKRIHDIMYRIATSDQYRIEKMKLLFPKEPIIVKDNPKFSKDIIKFSMLFAEAEKTYGFRRQKQLQTLMAVNALIEGRREVTKDDFDEVVRLLDFMNLEYKKL